MSSEKIYQLFRLFWTAVAAQPLLFIAFVGLTLGSALTEGLGVGLLIPLLQQGSVRNTGGALPWVDRYLATVGDTSSSNFMVSLVLILAAVILVRCVLQLAASYVAIKLPARLHMQLSTEAYDKALSSGLEFLATSDGGVLRTMIQDYPQRLASSIRSITDIIASMMLVAIYAALMLSVSWKMTLIAAVLVVMLGLLIKQALALPLARTGEALSIWQERWNTQIYETGLSLKLIQLLNAQDLMSVRNRFFTRNYFHYDIVRQMIGEAQGPLMTTFGGLFVCGMLIYGTIGSEGIQPAQLLVLVLCLYRLMTPGSRVLTQIVSIFINLDAFERQKRLDAPSESARQPDGQRLFETLTTGIKFAGVTFTYRGADRPALVGLSLEIARGEMIAIVGPSGAGKSSIVNLLGRLYEPEAGAIEINGVPLSDYRIASWRRKIAVVSQDTTLFNMTVRENVTFGIEDVTQTELDEAARRAAALDFINNLPGRWETPLGDRGARLSGGQQQRLAIVRALLRNPELLVLDEATSQLDSITERTIQEFMEAQRGKSTILVVAHRLSTIRRADRIAVMQEGRLVEFAPHDELARGKTRYRAMLDAQQLGLASEAAN